MKKFSIVILFILGFFVVFALSAVITFTLTLDRDKEATEATTEEVQNALPETVVPVDTDIEDEVTVTRVTPSLSVADAIIVKGVYGAQAPEAESSYIQPEAVVADDVEEDIIENEVVEVKAEVPKTETKKEEPKKAEAPKTETKKEEVKAETPKAETKKEEVKTETPKTETKKEEVKAEETKTEEKKEEAKAQEPEIEEKVEEPVVEEKPVVLDPNKQYSDTGI